jgi:hypothetical protein
VYVQAAAGLTLSSHAETYPQHCIPCLALPRLKTFYSAPLSLYDRLEPGNEDMAKQGVIQRLHEEERRYVRLRSKNFLRVLEEMKRKEVPEALGEIPECLFRPT